LTDVEQSILDNQKQIKRVIKLISALVILSVSVFLFTNSFDEFDSTKISADKFTTITASIKALDCEEPRKGSRVSTPGTAKILLEGAPDWLYISLYKFNSQTCKNLYTKLKLNQSATIMLLPQSKEVSHFELGNSILFTHEDYILEKKESHKDSKWFYLIICFSSLFYVISMTRQLFT